MEAKNLNELLNLFNTQADSVKNRLTDLLVTVSDGRIPDTETLKSFNIDMDELVAGYTKLKNEAQTVLNAEEMPKEGSKASAYVEAVHYSNSRMIMLQLEKAESILRRFLKVKSLIAEYENAISPFKEKAANVLQEISEENISEMISEIDAPERFLEALDTENINGPEGFRVLEQINKYYPMQVQWGLAGGQYFVDENSDKDVEVTSVEEPEEFPVDGEDGASEQSEINFANIISEEAEIVDNVDVRTNQSENMADASEEPIQEEKQESVDIEDSATSLDVLNAVNRVKDSSPSASSFKKEIVKLAKNGKEVRAILPLMTNLASDYRAIAGDVKMYAAVLDLSTVCEGWRLNFR